MKSINKSLILRLFFLVLWLIPITAFSRPFLDKIIKKTVMIPMRDGVTLATDLYFPDEGEGPFPIILMRTPYNKEILQAYGEYFSIQGFLFATQDVRGRFQSQGNWEPFINEGEDGYDAIEWLAKQEYSTGKIGMYGGSYSGSVQFAAAILKPPHLVTIIPNVAPAIPFMNMPYEGGVLVMGASVRWIDIIENAKTHQQTAKKVQGAISGDWNRLLNVFPVIDLDKKIIGEKNSSWRNWVEHNYDDAYWEKVVYLEKLKELDIPVFLQSGWFDGGNRGVKLAYESLKQSKNRNIKMIVGPWEHTDQSSRYLFRMDMGDKADIGIMDIYIKWFDYWLKSKKNGITDEPMVQIFNIGRNQWFKANTYPLPNTSFTKFYFSSDKGANSSMGDGKLINEASGSKSKYDKYIYDPADPSPCFYSYLKSRATESYMKMLEIRKDILVYKSEPLEEALTIAGPIRAVINASSSAKDTDFGVQLTVESKDGGISPIGQTWGIIRARFRNSMKNPEFLEKDKVYEYTIDMSHAGYTFEKGEKIRVEVSSAFYPEYSRNLNTGGHNEMETEFVTAEQKVYHNGKYLSYIILPVIK